MIPMILADTTEGSRLSLANPENFRHSEYFAQGVITQIRETRDSPVPSPCLNLAACRTSDSVGGGIKWMGVTALGARPLEARKGSIWEYRN